MKKNRPGVPILLVEHLIYPKSRFVRNLEEDTEKINSEFRKAYAALKKEGMKDIYYLPAKDLIGDDGEATVDGAHLTDLGFMRIAAQFEKELKKILPK